MTDETSYRVNFLEYYIGKMLAERVMYIRNPPPSLRIWPLENTLWTVRVHKPNTAYGRTKPYDGCTDENTF